MFAKAFSRFLSNKGLIWTGAALLSAIAIPAVGATASHLAHHRTHLTQRTANHSTAQHRTAAKPMARSATMSSQKATRMAHKSTRSTPLASVGSMHSGHVSASSSSKLASTSHSSAAKKLSTSHSTRSSASHLTAQHKLTPTAMK